MVPPQAAQAPSKDLSAREVGAALHAAEHALHLQRAQRALLARLARAAARLDALARALAAFSAASAVPPQVESRPPCCSY